MLNASGAIRMARFFAALVASELGHYKVFLKLALKLAPRKQVEERWQQMLAAEARILSEQLPGPRIHSGSANPVG